MTFERYFEKEIKRFAKLLEDIERRNNEAPKIHQKELLKIIMHDMLMHKKPTNGELAHTFDKEYTPQNYSLILKKFNELFLNK